MKKCLALSSTHIVALSGLLALPAMAQENSAPQSPAAAQNAETPTTTASSSAESSTASVAVPENGVAPEIGAVPQPTIPLPATPEAPAQTSLADERIQAGEGVAVLTLEEAIYLTLQNNPQREAAQAALAAAQARIGTARSAGGLQVGLNGRAAGERRFGTPVFQSGGMGGGGAVPGTGVTPVGDKILGFYVTEQVGLDATLPIYTGGRVKASTRVAEANTRAQAAQLLQIGGDLVLQTVTSYTGILRGEQLLQVAESNLAVSRERLRIAQVRFDAGAAPRLEVLRAQTTLADSQTRRINASNALAQNQAALNILLGRAPETPVRVEPITRLNLNLPLPASIETRTSTQVVGESAQLRDLADRARPTIAVAREQVRAADANVDVAKAQRKPSIGASLSGLLRNPVTFAGRFLLGIGVSVAQTLFDSGRSRSQINEARASLDQSKFNLQTTRLTVSNQIEQALLALDSAEEREKSADAAVVAGQEALRAAQIGYGAGVRTALEVSDAQDALLQTQTQAVNARFDVTDAQARLATAVGVLTAEGQAAYNRALQDETARLQKVAAEEKKLKKKKS